MSCCLGRRHPPITPCPENNAYVPQAVQLLEPELALAVLLPGRLKRRMGLVPSRSANHNPFFRVSTRRLPPTQASPVAVQMTA